MSNRRSSRLVVPVDNHRHVRVAIRLEGHLAHHHRRRQVSLATRHLCNQAHSRRDSPHVSLVVNRHLSRVDVHRTSRRVILQVSLL